MTALATSKGIPDAHTRRGDERRAQSQGPRTGQTTLLLIDADNSQQLTARCSRGWIRLASRLLASSLDYKLAEGQSPESSRLLAARAQVLVAPASRRETESKVGRTSWYKLVGHPPCAIRDCYATANTSWRASPTYERC